MVKYKHQRVYEVLKRWARLGHAGPDDTPQQYARKVGIKEIDEVGMLVKESPELGAYCVLPWSRSASIYHRQPVGGCSQPLRGVPT